jgi:hypothetical protein
LPRSQSSAMRYAPNIGRSVGCLAGSASTLAPGPRGFTPAAQVKANWMGWLSFLALSRGNAYGPLPTVRAFRAPGTPTRPSADSYGVLGDHYWPLSPLQAMACRDTPQVSRGMLLHFRGTTAGLTSVVLAGYGLRARMRTRPTSTPPIQFLCVGSHLGYTLLSDLTSR